MASVSLGDANFVARAVIYQLRMEVAKAVKLQIDDIVKDAVTKAIDSIQEESFAHISKERFGYEVSVIVKDAREKKNEGT